MVLQPLFLYNTLKRHLDAATPKCRGMKHTMDEIVTAHLLYHIVIKEMRIIKLPQSLIEQCLQKNIDNLFQVHQIMLLIKH